MQSFNPIQIEKNIIKQKVKLKKLSHNYKINFENIEKKILIEVEEIEKLTTQNKKIIPEINYANIKNKLINNEIFDLVKKRGCVVIRNVFEKEKVIEWNHEIERYIDENNYYEDQKEKAGLDQYFSDLQSGKPQIFGLYWSKPQIEARQSESMAIVKSWLNNLWKYEFNNKKIFDPNKELVYADRIRRREGGDVSLGLSPHCDAGSVERWIDSAYQKIYEPIFSDQLSNYDPFNAQFRDQTEEISSAAVSHVFRTFQGWLALTEQGPFDGTLQLIPIIKSMAYILTRALLNDVPNNSLCGSMPARALSVNSKYHSVLLRALVSIPRVYPGDTVWWHPDVVHAVEDKHHGKNYSNVIYIGSTPYCQKNLDYSKKQSANFLEGKSPPDFAAEDYEVNYTGRATTNDLTTLGKKQMGLESWG